MRGRQLNRWVAHKAALERLLAGARKNEREVPQVADVRRQRSKRVSDVFAHRQVHVQALQVRPQPHGPGRRPLVDLLEAHRYLASRRCIQALVSVHRQRPDNFW